MGASIANSAVMTIIAVAFFAQCEKIRALRPTSPHSVYRADIDGLRAIAVLAVVCSHAFPAQLPGGFIGVDIFFVISGYLITRILLSGQIGIREFYIRRIRRIFPALILVLATCLVIGWLALLPGEYALLGKHTLAGAAFFSNLALYSEAGYFDVASAAKPLMHLWSLGVEEQFYIAWPLLLISMLSAKRNILYAVVALGILSFGANLYLSQQDASAAFYWPLTRLWELLAGAGLAYITFHASRLLKHLLSLAGLLFLIDGLLVIDSSTAYPGAWALLPVIGTVLLIASEGGCVNRLLAWRGLVYLGLISYPLYLWHWPLLSFLHIVESGEPPLRYRVTAVLLSVVLAAITYHCIELPWRKRGVMPMIFCMLLLAAAGTWIYQQRGIPSRPLSLAEDQLTAFDYGADHYASKECKARYPIDRLDFCQMANTDRPATVALIGDSHANHLYWGLREIYPSLLHLGGQGSCFLPATRGSVASGCDAMTQAVIKQVAEDNRIHTVIVSLRPRTDDLDLFQQTLEAMLRQLGKRHIIFALGVPDLGFDPKSCLDRRPLRISEHVTRTPCAVPRLHMDSYRVAVAHMLQKFPQVQFIDPADALCDDTLCWGKRDGKILYRDKEHLSIFGSLYLAEKLRKKFH